MPEQDTNYEKSSNKGTCEILCNLEFPKVIWPLEGLLISSQGHNLEILENRCLMYTRAPGDHESTENHSNNAFIIYSWKGRQLLVERNRWNFIFF